MISIFFRKDKTYIYYDEKYYDFDSSDFELDLEDIILDLDIKKKEKIDIILDFNLNEDEYYIKLLKEYGLSINRLYLIKDLLIEDNKELIYHLYDKLIFLSSEKEEVLDFTVEDNIDLTGITEVKNDDIEYIFSLLKKTKLKSRYIKEYFKREYVLAIIILFVFANYYISTKLFDKTNLYSEKNILIDKINNIDREVEERNLEIKKLKEERIEENIYKKLKKYELSSYLTKIFDLSKKDFYFYSIGITRKITSLEGVCRNLDILNENIGEYELVDMKKYDENNLYFKIKMKNEGDVNE